MKYIFNKKSLPGSRQAFTMIELVLIVVIVGFLVMLLLNLPSSINLIGDSSKTSIAKDIASTKLENLRSLGFSNLSLASDEPFSDARLASLYLGAAIYSVEDCQNPVCSTTELNNSIEIKQVTVKVTWKEKDATKEVKLSTLVAEGGLR